MFVDSNIVNTVIYTEEKTFDVYTSMSSSSEKANLVQTLSHSRKDTLARLCGGLYFAPKWSVFWDHK